MTNLGWVVVSGALGWLEHGCFVLDVKAALRRQPCDHRLTPAAALTVKELYTVRM